MVPRLLALLLLVLPAFADGRPAWVEAKDALEAAYFDQLEPDQRDRWFSALGAWDHPETVTVFGEIASRYGAYMDQLESQIGDCQKKLDPLKRRRALTEQQIGLRNHYTAALEKLEALRRLTRLR